MMGRGGAWSGLVGDTTDLTEGGGEKCANGYAAHADNILDSVREG